MNPNPERQAEHREDQDPKELINKPDINQGPAEDVAHMSEHADKEQASSHDILAQRDSRHGPRQGQPDHDPEKGRRDDSAEARNQPETREPEHATYKHSDNAESKDSDRPYEDVIMDEAYDETLSEGTKKLPTEE